MEITLVLRHLVNLMGKELFVLLMDAPPRIPLSEADIQVDLDRRTSVSSNGSGYSYLLHVVTLSFDYKLSLFSYRKPDQSRITTPRKKTDIATILSCVVEGYTTGIQLVSWYPIQTKGEKISEMSMAYRPSRGDVTYDFKYGIRSVMGGGQSSARETIGRVAGCAVATKALEAYSGIEIHNSHISIQHPYFRHHVRMEVE
ncbi:chorismate synthase protein [Artemisia annua]|uniref:chorismate synthase n=1 Tax=Artemisia annua TaxID=35608 RepID=A0A2U1NT65_ARTAN|nr:chorismate synthase protein [Artemisia annua]